MTPQDVRNNANTGQGRTAGFFSLPAGIRLWEPGKPNTYMIDMIPYEVKSANHPDKKNAVVPGVLWYKHPFIIFKNVGVNNETIVSPASVGLPCPIMEYRNTLTEDWEANKEKIKALGMQKWTAFTILDPDDKSRAAIFAISDGKFWGADAGLDKELSGGDDSIAGFYLPDGGKTLKARFVEATFNNNTYIQCNRIDFIDREDMDEEALVAMAPCLDECFNTIPYDTLKAMFYQVDAAAAGGATGEPPRAGTGKPKLATTQAPPLRTTAGSKPTPTGKPTAPPAKKGTPPLAPAPEPEEENTDLIEVGAAVEWDEEDKTLTGVVKEINDAGDEALVVEDEEGDEYDVPISALRLATTEGDDAAPAAEDDDTPGEEPDDDATGGGEETGGDGGLPDPKVGDRIKDDTGVVGTVTEVAGEDITIKREDNGKTMLLDKDDIKEILPPAKGGKAAPKPTAPAKGGGKATKFVPAEGAVCRYDGDDVTIVKIKDDKARVKDYSGGLNWVKLAELEPPAKK